MIKLLIFNVLENCRVAKHCLFHVRTLSCMVGTPAMRSLHTLLKKVTRAYPSKMVKLTRSLGAHLHPDYKFLNVGE